MQKFYGISLIFAKIGWQPRGNAKRLDPKVKVECYFGVLTYRQTGHDVGGCKAMVYHLVLPSEKK